MISITVLGSTGTIGVNTLDVIARHPHRYKVFALTANGNVDGLLQQCLRWCPRYAVMADAEHAETLQRKLRSAACETEVLAGVEGLQHVASHAEVNYVMAAIVGAAGLLPTLAAARVGKRVLLANKEALVMSGQVFIQAARESGAELLPIDSEHNAIFQCLPPNFGRGLAASGVSKILLTASGGPFRTLALTELRKVTPAQACAHPNWVMGRKISVDSATMMNKGLEVIEACWLFNVTDAQIDVVIHPQSVIHSLVQYIDGSVLAQLGNPDMRTPIAHALAWPERIDAGVKPLDLVAVGQLAFEPPDTQRFPCLRLAREAMTAGGTATAVLNAANEVAVAEFLEGELSFADIPAVIENTLSKVSNHPATSLAAVLQADEESRNCAREMIRSFCL